jgi:hypothetical protein
MTYLIAIGGFTSAVAGAMRVLDRPEAFAGGILSGRFLV